MAGAIVRFRSGTSAFTARDADHYTTIAIVLWSGWLVSIQRPPASETGTLPAELHPALFGCRTWNLTKDLSLIGRSLSMLSYTAALKPCSRLATPDRCFADWPSLRNRDAPSVAFSSREENCWLREVDSNHYQTH